MKRVFACLFVVLVALSCRSVAPPNKPEELCQASCKKYASANCSEKECARGCELILDRIVEREGDNVVKCVAKWPRRCGDIVWADCASRIGAHADGGPPGPPPPVEEE